MVFQEQGSARHRDAQFERLLRAPGNGPPGKFMVGDRDVLEQPVPQKADKEIRDKILPSLKIGHVLKHPADKFFVLLLVGCKSVPAHLLH